MRGLSAAMLQLFMFTTLLNLNTDAIVYLYVTYVEVIIYLYVTDVYVIK